MKKIIAFVIFTLFVNFCYGQNLSNEQRLIGSWELNSNSVINYGSPNLIGTWVFDANGTFRVGNGSSGKYGVTETKLYLLYTSINAVNYYDYSISSDGKTLILTTVDGIYSFWLTKK
jgi:hypothetical protein